MLNPNKKKKKFHHPKKALKKIHKMVKMPDKDFHLKKYISGKMAIHRLTERKKQQMEEIKMHKTKRLFPILIPFQIRQVNSS
jgi:hypothetical protein